MKKLFLLLCLFAPLFSFGQQSIEELKKELEDAEDSKDRMYLNYELGKAYLRSDAEASIEYAKRAHRLARDNGNSAMGAQAAFLVGRGYERERNERNADVWYRTALANAKKAQDLDLIVKSVQRRGRLAEKDRDYRDAYQIYEDAFKFFSQKGTSVSDLASKFERQKALLAQERERLQKEIERLEDERDELSSDRNRLQQQQQQLVQEKQQVEQEVYQKEEKLADVSAAKAKADSLAEINKKKYDQLTAKEARKEALLQRKKPTWLKLSLMLSSTDKKQSVTKKSVIDCSF